MPAPASATDVQLFVGVDIALKSATAALLLPGRQVHKSFSFPQSPAGFEQFKRRLLAVGRPAKQILVVMEATSTYWIQLASYLHQAGMRVAVVNPAQAHDFAKALLKRSKTDPIDAQTLAQLAAMLLAADKLPLWSPPPAVYHELGQRLAQRDNLLAVCQVLRNQRHALVASGVAVPKVLERQDKLIEQLKEQIEELEREIATAVELDAAWAASVRLLDEIKGVGLLTASWLVVSTLNFSLTRSAEQAAGYAGLAPREKRSGSSVRGKPQIGHYGNGRLRQALYMASLSAVQHNALLKAYYERLLGRGKPPKVARCAVMRKLMCIAWAVASKGVAFDPQHASKQVA